MPGLAAAPFSWHIGVTGGIGSGKSTVTGILQAAGACVIDADQLARDCTRPHGAAIAHIRSAFGDTFIDADGSMRRDRMRKLVFRDPIAKHKLESIIHPLVLQQAQTLAAEAARQGYRVIVYDIPLLAESAHWRKRLDRVVVVDCDEATQIQRVMQRSGLTQAAAASIIASQASRQQRWQIADAVIDNGASTTLQQLHTQVRALASNFGLISG